MRRPSEKQQASSPATGTDEEIRVGVSMCLLGEEVRHDGGHKRDHYVTDVLGRYFRLMPVCPEVEIGMGIPRETLRLVRDGEAIRMIAPHSSTDHTRAMRRYATTRARQLGRVGLRGYVFKKGSPSCGMARVRTFTPAGTPSISTRGLFAAAVMERIPLLPVEEEGRLADARLRESFVERVFAYNRLRRLFAARWSVRSLLRFHAEEQYLLTAHSAPAQRELARLVATATDRGRAEVAEEYQRRFMTAIARPITHRRHVDVLQQLGGLLERSVSTDEKTEIIETIADFAEGNTPLLVPLTLLRHHARRHCLLPLARQSYLAPHPKELMLRYHA